MPLKDGQTVIWKGVERMEVSKGPIRFQMVTPENVLVSGVGYIARVWQDRQGEIERWTIEISGDGDELKLTALPESHYVPRFDELVANPYYPAPREREPEPDPPDPNECEMVRKLRARVYNERESEK